MAQSCQWCSCYPMKQAWGRNDCLLYPQAVQKVKSLTLDCVVSHHLSSWKLSKKRFFFFSNAGILHLLIRHWVHQEIHPYFSLQGPSGRCPQLDHPAVTDDPVPAPPRVTPKAGSRRNRSSQIQPPEPSPAWGGCQGGWPRRVSAPVTLAGAGEQAAHHQPLSRRIESHRLVIRYAASFCTAHTANPCTIFLSAFPPPPTVLLTSLHTGETEQLRKQPSGGKFLKVFWAHPTWGEHSKKNRKGWVGAPSAPTHKPGIVTPAHPRAQQGPTAGPEPQCPHTKVCECVFCEDDGMETTARLFQTPRQEARERNGLTAFKQLL